MQSNSDITVSSKSGIQINKETVNEFAKKYGALCVFIILIVANSVFTPNFAKVNTMWNILIQVTPIMLVALGMTIVISSGGIDISVGSIMAISSIVTAKLLPFGVIPAIMGGLILASCFGLFNGFMISHFKIQPIIITLTLMISGRGIAQVINNANLLNFTEPKFSFIGTYRFFGIIPIQVLIMAVAFSIIYFVMKKMTFGRYVQAIGDNHKASRLAGMNTFVTILVVYALCSLMAGTAGLIQTARLSAADANSIGKLMELDAIASVAVGGTAMSGGRANVIGTVIGALIMQIITVTVNMNNIPFSYSLVLKSIIIIAAVYIQRERNT